MECSVRQRGHRLQQSTMATTVAQNLALVRERIARVAEKVGRAASDITLIGVTKYVGESQAAALLAAGCSDLGESRPQQLWDRAGSKHCTGDVRWHLIGHLQRNKIARTLPLAYCLQSVDSLRLLTAINTEATKQSLTARVLLEVNCSGDAEKHGFTPQAIVELAPKLNEFSAIDVTGLMTMAARGGDLAVAAGNFAALRKLRDKHLPDLPELSMGMTGDFEVAIAEGATIVRVGSALWEGVERG